MSISAPYQPYKLGFFLILIFACTLFASTQREVKDKELIGVERSVAGADKQKKILYAARGDYSLSLIDSNGILLKSWQPVPFSEHLYDSDWYPGIKSAAISKDNTLYILYQYSGIKAYDFFGKELWQKKLAAGGDLAIDSEQNILSLAFEPVSLTAEESDLLVLMPRVIKLSSTGELLQEKDLSLILKTFLNEGLVKKILHWIMQEEQQLPPYNFFKPSSLKVQTGQNKDNVLLISFANLDLLIALNLNSLDLVWSMQGQELHQPSDAILIDEKEVLVYNAARDFEFSNISLIDIDSGEAKWQYNGTPHFPFDSSIGGSLAELSSGNFLLSNNEGGEIREIGKNGQVLWSYKVRSSFISGMNRQMRPANKQLAFFKVLPGEHSLRGAQ